jgi:hypothetical protein
VLEAGYIKSEKQNSNLVPFQKFIYQIVPPAPDLLPIFQIFRVKANGNRYPLCCFARASAWIGWAKSAAIFGFVFHAS